MAAYHNDFKLPVHLSVYGAPRVKEFKDDADSIDVINFEIFIEFDLSPIEHKRSHLCQSN
jgi:hypothetical protein